MKDDPRLFTLEDGSGLQITLMDWGATWLSCRVPAGGGGLREVLLGHRHPADHLSQPGHLGAIVGRYANRIAGARFALDGREWALASNEGPNQLHGGPQGFGKRRWTPLAYSARELRLGLVSPDGDQGFPGCLEVEVAYRIEGPGTVAITFDARCDAPCPVNLTGHAYFNLDGDVPPLDIRHHRVAIAASAYLPVDDALIPTGRIEPVDGTPFDLRQSREIGSLAYDHCFVLDPSAARGETPAARLWSTDGRLQMTMWADHPGLQFYTGAWLWKSTDRRGQTHPPHAGLALEPQAWPDSPNRPQWPSSVLRPGERYLRNIRVRFEATPQGRSV